MLPGAATVVFAWITIVTIGTSAAAPVWLLVSSALVTGLALWFGGRTGRFGRMFLIITGSVVFIVSMVELVVRSLVP